MATREILPFAEAGGANVLTQADYAAAATLRNNGFVAGIADSKSVNKVLRQAVFMAVGLAEALVQCGISVPDDGNISALATNIVNGLGGGSPRASWPSCVGGGTPDAITGAINAADAVLYDQQKVVLNAGGANTLTNPTFNLSLNGTPSGAKTVVKNDGDPLLPGDIAGIDAEHLLVYSSILDQWVLINPASSPTAQRDFLSAGGYMFLPGGFLVQWGLSPVIPTGATGGTITFPTPFPNVCFHVFLQYQNNASTTATDGNPVMAHPPTQADVHIYQAGGGASQYSYLAIGY